MKKCSNCKVDKEIEFFGSDRGRSDGKNVYCLDCTRAKRQTNRDKINARKRDDYWKRHDYHLQQKQNDYSKHKKQRLKYGKKYYQENSEASKKRANDYYHNHKEQASVRAKEYRLRNAEIIKQKKREYYQRPEVKSNASIKNREWKRNNPEKRREMDKRYYNKYPHRKIIKNMRTRIFTILKREGAFKSGHIIEQLGCTPEFLKQYIESKFYSYVNKDGQTIEMTWDKLGNGPGTFQIDHIIPLFSFDFSIPNQQSIANHYTNLQPLWFNDHNRKSQSDFQYQQNFEGANTGFLPKFTNSSLTVFPILQFSQ